jgi:hypothetical protein
MSNLNNTVSLDGSIESLVFVFRWDTIKNNYKLIVGSGATTEVISSVVITGAEVAPKAINVIVPNYYLAGEVLKAEAYFQLQVSVVGGVEDVAFFTPAVNYPVKGSDGLSRFRMATRGVRRTTGLEFDDIRNNDIFFQVTILRSAV